MRTMAADLWPVLAGLAIGAVAGLAYFAGLWWTVRRLPHARRPVLVWGLSAALRAAGIAASFLALLRWAPEALIAAALGFLIARLLAVRLWGALRMPAVPGGPEEACR
ncbi:MAG: ATP synthase subunit I [Armatimonadota bacterium]